jgi:transcriptional regulator with XRE-family HTH domain
MERVMTNPLMSAADFKSWRDRTGWTQTELAERLGVARSTVQNWEGGLTPVPGSVSTLCGIWDRELKKRDDVGPVTLIYADAPIIRSAYSMAPIATIKHEAFANNAEALRRVDELWGREDFRHPQIVDADETVWNFIELARRHAERNRRPRRTS